MSLIWKLRRRLCIKPKKRALIGSALFIIMSMVVGILTVCLTKSKPKSICELTYRRAVRSTINYNSQPQSVAVGYFNNDTQLDFVVANKGMDTIGVYLGYNNGTFEYQTTYSTGDRSRPFSVAVGDFDRDNTSDIAVANFGTNSIGIFFGFNNGKFTIQTSFSTGSSRPLFIAVSDFNHDNRLDIAAVNYGTHSVGIFIGFGNGSFALSITYSTDYDSLPNSLAIGDLNNDNRLDIVVANSGTNNIGIFFGYGNGTFQDQKIYYTGFKSNPLSVVTGDLNNDGHLDIVAANYGTHNIGIFFGYSNGTFNRQITYSTGSNSRPKYLSIGDFNKDNKSDIIITDADNAKVHILPGHDNGTFPQLTIYPTGTRSSPVSVTVGDFNNDSKSDVLVVNRGTNNVLALVGYEVKRSVNYTTYSTGKSSSPLSITTGDINSDSVLDIVVANEGADTVGVFLGYGDGTFSVMSTFSTGNGSSPYVIAFGDFNNDHQLDIAVANHGTRNVAILLGFGNGTFSDAVTCSTGIGSSPYSLSVGDVNNDNCLDIVVVNVGSDTMEVFLGYCNGTFLIVSTYSTGSTSNVYSIAIDDFNNDNRLDVVITSYNAYTVGIFLGYGNGTFVMTASYSTGDLSFPFSVTSADFNNDNRLDIVVTLFAINQIGILFGVGDGNFIGTRIYPLEFGIGPLSLAVDDFDNDNQLDIAVINGLSNSVLILFGNNNGDFPRQTTYSTGDNSKPTSIIFEDFNNDNLLDIAVTNNIGNTVGIFISYYYADFAIQTKYSTGSGPHPYSVTTGDFNNDNNSDIVVANSGNENIGIRLGIGDGTFGVETTYSTGPNSFPQYVNVGDFNRDNQLDIVIADSKNSSLSVFFADDNGTFGESVTYLIDPQSNPNSIGIGDFNNDKWLDLVVANEGTNNVGIFYGFNYSTFDSHQTYLTGSHSSPFSVAVGDLNNDNRLDIIVANFDSNNVGIFYGHENGTFTTQITYSTGDYSVPLSIALADFNNDSHLDIVFIGFGAKYLGILLGYGNGTFQAITTYLIHGTAYSSWAEVVVGDVNNDDRLDVVVAIMDTNNIGVFLGFGDGTFSAITKYSTGLNSKPRSIDLGDLNNDHCLDIVVANSNSNSLDIFHGNGDGSFALTMTYSTGNESSPFSVALGDFNNDHHLDIAIANYGLDNVGVFLGFGNGTFSAQKTYSTGSVSGPIYVTVGFFNEDNQTDIAVICALDSAFTVLFGTGNERLLMGRKYTTSILSLVKSMAIGDFNNDTRIDVVVANARTDTIDVYLGARNENFASPLTISTGSDSKPHTAAVGDFNNDNRSDIVIANYGIDNIAILLANESTGFSVLMTYSTGNGSRPYIVVVGDFNSDNQLDIAVANSGTNNIMIFHGDGNGTFAKIGSYSTGADSVPYSTAINDFNNDKQMDIAIANSGTSNVLILFGYGNGTFGNPTSYSMGYNSHPYSLAVGDFNQDSWMDMAVANYGADYVEILLKTC